MKHNLRDVCSHFTVYGDFIIGVPFGTGHINDTYQVAFDQGGTIVHYTVQRINHNVFKNPPALMDNVERVTAHLTSKNLGKSGGSRRTLRVIRTLDGKNCYQDPDGNFWRCYVFVENSRTYDILETEKQAFEAARAFGKFQGELVDIPGGRLNETIPDFHNTPKRLANLEESIKLDKFDRVKNVQKEIDFVMSRRDDCGILLDLHKQGLIPERITHNDTKLNNVLIDDFTGEGICVIDLDTVMPGLAHYDFGDMIRTGTSPALEDEPDLSKVTMRFNMFEALLRGYLAGGNGFLNEVELEYLPFAGKLITMEIGIRFLTDYLDGDIYFKTHRNNHNIDRCHTQFKLVESIEEQMDAMKMKVKETAKEYKA
ncbi:MAG: aminoglycoside phosphotransferase family protein [Lentisphaeria bacterium]|nr:aminoglycoside phosphotransferase family protein [Lentisphaeria bacterium]